MCGIFGSVAWPTPFSSLQGFEASVQSLVHRGPDDQGIVMDGGRVWSNDSEEQPPEHPFAVLGQRRLSIIDLSSGGHQPMHSEDRRYWITYNGEFYNYREIRHELAAKGYRFRSETDTEVLLAGYQEWKEGILDRVNGMFAFAIWDTKTRELFLARDRLGIKPLYYHLENGVLSFASEVKALLCLPWIEAEVDHESLIGQITLLWTPEPKTPFAGIEKLPSGHWARFRDGEFQVASYWDVPVTAVDPSSAQERLEDLLDQAVQRRMISDVPVGAFLSGGLDSSLVVAMMQQATSEPVRTFTIAFRPEDTKQEAMPPDAEYAQVVARHLGTDHEEIQIDPDVSTTLPEMVRHVEEPFVDPAAINTYLICQKAQERGVRVMLSGMGADEIFAGYRKHLSVALAEQYKRLPSLLRRLAIEQPVARLPVAGKRGGYQLIRWAKRFLKSAPLPTTDCFIGNSSYYNAAELQELLSEGKSYDFSDSYAVRRHYDEFEKWQDRDLVSQMTYADTKLFLPSLNLAYSDKSSMAASVELRVPFVDHEMVTFALNLPSSLRLRRQKQKFLLKRVAEAHLPKEIIWRPKAPFGAPLRAWMRKDLKDVLEDALSERRIRERGYFRYSAIREMIDRNEAGKEDYAHRLWALLTLEMWHRMFIDQKPSAEFGG